MVMPVDNLGEVEFSFDAAKTSADDVAAEVCVSKQVEWGLQTQEALVQNCIPPVSAFITNTLRERKVIA